MNAAFRSLQLERLAVVRACAANSTSISRPHSGAGALLLVHRDAFGEPARHALVRHLQRDDVRELVPQRRFPLELARGRACGESIVTTRPKQAPSAPIIPGRPTLRTAKSSCFGKISMRIGPFGVKS